MNVVGGYVVTDRMLRDVPQRPRPRRSGRPVSAFDTVVAPGLPAAAVCFVLGLHLMNSPATARRGNQLSAAGHGRRGRRDRSSLLVARRHVITATGWLVLVAGLAVGAVAGLVTARRVKMTAMPQLVSLFNAVGGGAAALIALGDASTTAGASADRRCQRRPLADRARHRHRRGHLHRIADRRGQAGRAASPGRPIVFPGARLRQRRAARWSRLGRRLVPTGRGTAASPVLVCWSLRRARLRRAR